MAEDEITLSKQVCLFARNGQANDLRKLLVSMDRKQVAEMINQRDHFEGYYTPLMLAGQSGDVATARLLLQEGADPMEMTDGLNSPLWLACNEFNVEMASLLLSYAPDAVNSESLIGWTPLMVAAIGGNLEIISMLLRVPGVKVNQIDKFGQNALSYAMAYRHDQVVDLLQCFGAALPSQTEGMIT